MLFTFKFQEILEGKGPLVEYAGDDKLFIDVIVSLLESINKDLTLETKIELNKIAVVSGGGKVLSKEEVNQTSNDVQQVYGDKFTIAPRASVGGHDLSELVSATKDMKVEQAVVEKTTISTPAAGLPTPKLPSLANAGGLKDLIAPKVDEGKVIKKEIEVKEKVVAGDIEKEKHDLSPPTPITATSTATKPPTPPPSGGMAPPTPAPAKFEPPMQPEEKKTPAAAAPETTKVEGISIEEPVIIEKEEERLHIEEEIDEDFYVAEKMAPSPAEEAPAPRDEVLLDLEERASVPPEPERKGKEKKVSRPKPAGLTLKRRASRKMSMKEAGELDLTGVEARPKAEIFDKNISVEYFDRMNPESYYPLIVDISNLEQKIKAIEENILTGERKVQKKEKIHVELEVPVVKVRPIFPGCTVTPPEMDTDFKDEDDKLVFYVTPLVRDKIEGHIEFINNKGEVFQKVKTPAKCKDPRHARVIAAYGLLASMVPKVLEFFGLKVDEIFSGITDALPGGWTFVGAFAAIVSAFAVLFAVIYFLKQRPTMARRRFHFTDFKMALVADEVIRITS